jgi:hypothetical protein
VTTARRLGSRLTLLLGAPLLFTLLGTLLGGCARVRPWERDQLADPRMQSDANRVEKGVDDHIYFSKEASSGGSGFGGGGCGCN